jgi:hypothetical protein
MKIIKVKSWNRIPNTVQNIVKIEVHTTYSAVFQYMILQNQYWVIEATKAYEVASTVEYKHNPPNLMVKEAILHWKSPKNEPPPSQPRCFQKWKLVGRVYFLDDNLHLR